jgi:hypothetical protein
LSVGPSSYCPIEKKNKQLLRIFLVAEVDDEIGWRFVQLLVLLVTSS